MARKRYGVTRTAAEREQYVGMRRRGRIDARASTRAGIAISATIWAVVESVSQCDDDSLENVARGIARFVHVQADRFLVRTSFPVAL